jgi:hypothetical protein
MAVNRARSRRKGISRFELVNEDRGEGRAGILPACGGEAAAMLALTRSLGRQDACPTLRFRERVGDVARGFMAIAGGDARFRCDEPRLFR